MREGEGHGLSRTILAVLGWLGCAIVVAVILTGLVVLCVYVGKPDGGGSGQVAITVMVQALAGVIVWTVALLLLIIFVAVCQVFRTHQQIFGSSAGPQILGLAIAAWLFPRGVTSVFVVPVQAIAGFFAKALAIIGDPSVFGARVLAGETMTLSVLLDATLRYLRNAGVLLLESFRQMIGSLPIVDIVFTLALWIVFGQLLSSSQETASREPGDLGRSHLANYLRELASKHPHGIYLALILLISGFLCISAVVTIPLLEGKAPAPPEVREQLDKELKTKLMTTEAFNKEFPEDLSRKDAGSKGLEDPLEKLRQSLETWRTESGQSGSDQEDKAKNRYKDYLTSAQGAVDSALDARRGAGLLWESALGRARKEMDNLVHRAMADYDAHALYPMSSQGRQHYLSILRAWVEDGIGVRLEGLKLMKTALEKAEKEVERHCEQIRANVSTLKDSKAPATTVVSVSLDELASPYKAVYWRMALSGGTGAPPAPSGLEGDLGLFGVVTGWLARTKSLPFTLITGMLGFGLLGAAISSTIRRGTQTQTERDKTVSATGTGDGRDLFFVMLISGMSAAVVVFLAVKSGLAAFGSAGIEPNPYMLFFTCLVGAVFSEYVWKWAHEKLHQNLPPGGGDELADQHEEKQAAPGKAAKQGEGSSVESQKPGGPPMTVTAEQAPVTASVEIPTSGGPVTAGAAAKQAEALQQPESSSPGSGSTGTGGQQQTQ